MEGGRNSSPSGSFGLPSWRVSSRNHRLRHHAVRDWLSAGLRPNQSWIILWRGSARRNRCWWQSMGPLVLWHSHASHRGHCRQFEVMLRRQASEHCLLGVDHLSLPFGFPSQCGPTGHGCPRFLGNEAAGIMGECSSIQRHGLELS